MVSDSILEFLKRLALGLSKQFGENCEVVVHDLTQAEHSIVAIENGHVTGRHDGDGPSKVVLEALRGDRAKLDDHLCYLTKTKDGRILKSSTIYLRDDDGDAVGIFSINYDITALLTVDAALRSIISTDEPQSEPERIPSNVNDLLDELINQSVRLVGKPVSLMTKEDKTRAIQFLADSGAFLITKSGNKVSRFFGISKYTLYNYIDAKRKDSNE